jgi:hypothetical protein
MTKEEARPTIEAELFAMKLRKRMVLPEKIAFCESAHRRWVFQSETDRLRDPPVGGDLAITVAARQTGVR